MTQIFIVLSWVNWSRPVKYLNSQLLRQLLSQKNVSSFNLETNKLFERRPEEEVSTELLKVWIHKRKM